VHRAQFSHPVRPAAAPVDAAPASPSVVPSRPCVIPGRPGVGHPCDVRRRQCIVTVPGCLCEPVCRPWLSVCGRECSSAENDMPSGPGRLPKKGGARVSCQSPLTSSTICQLSAVSCWQQCLSLPLNYPIGKSPSEAHPDSGEDICIMPISTANCALRWQSEDVAVRTLATYATQ
jgi:hypothetical protein